MAGIRPCIPNLDDKDITINSDSYKDSETVGPEIKSSVKTETNKQTEKMAASTSTEEGLVEVTSPVSGAIDNVPCESQDELITKNVNQSEIDKLKYISDNNPEYLDGLELSPEEIFAINSSGDSGYTYQENEVVMDENGLVYLDENQPEFFNQNQSSSQIFGTGQPKIIFTSADFSYPIQNFTEWGSQFGFRIISGEWRFHAGTDIGAEKGRPVLAICDGVIERTNTDGCGGGYGNNILLSFKYGQRKFECFYGHLSSVLVKSGDKSGEVKKGQVIGYVGNTGGECLKKPVTYPYHLHFEIRYRDSNKVWTNPTGDITKDYYGKKTKKLGDSCALVKGSQTLFQIKENKEKNYPSYIDPVKFFNYPKDQNQWLTI